MTLYLHTFLLLFPLALLFPAVVMVVRTVREIPRKDAEDAETAETGALCGLQRSEREGTWD